MGCGSSQEEPMTPLINAYDLEILKTQTRFNEDEIKVWWEAFITEEPDGEMSKRGFKSLYSRLYPRGKVDDFAEHLFAHYDSDGSGKIDFKEFMRTMDVSQKGSTDEKLKWAFGLYDSDKSGYISQDEVKEIVSAIYKMQGVSKDGDAYHGSVERVVELLFESLEKDKDGKLDADEFIIGSRSNPEVKKMLSSV